MEGPDEVKAWKHNAYTPGVFVGFPSVAAVERPPLPMANQTIASLGYIWVTYLLSMYVNTALGRDLGGLTDVLSLHGRPTCLHQFQPQREQGQVDRHVLPSRPLLCRFDEIPHREQSFHRDNALRLHCNAEGILIANSWHTCENV